MSERALVEVGTKTDKKIGKRGYNGHGLLTPGNPGNKGGGRPRDIHRDKLVKLCTTKGIAWLTSLLAAPRELTITCQCGQEHTVTPPGNDKVIIQAIDVAHKYGIGTYKEVEEHRTVTLIAPPPLA